MRSTKGVGFKICLLASHFFTQKDGLKDVSVPKPGGPQGAKAKIGTQIEAPDPNNNVSNMSASKKVAKGSDPALLSAKSKKRSLTRFNNHFVMKKKGKKGK